MDELAAMLLRQLQQEQAPGLPPPDSITLDYCCSLVATTNAVDHEEVAGLTETLAEQLGLGQVLDIRRVRALLQALTLGPAASEPQRAQHTSEHVHDGQHTAGHIQHGQHSQHIGLRPLLPESQPPAHTQAVVTPNVVATVSVGMPVALASALVTSNSAVAPMLRVGAAAFVPSWVGTSTGASGGVSAVAHPPASSLGWQAQGPVETQHSVRQHIHAWQQEGVIAAEGGEWQVNEQSAAWEGEGPPSGGWQVAGGQAEEWQGHQKAREWHDPRVQMGQWQGAESQVAEWQGVGVPAGKREQWQGNGQQAEQGTSYWPGEANGQQAEQGTSYWPGQAYPGHEQWSERPMGGWPGTLWEEPQRGYNAGYNAGYGMQDQVEQVDTSWEQQEGQEELVAWPQDTQGRGNSMGRATAGEELQQQPLKQQAGAEQQTEEDTIAEDPTSLLSLMFPAVLTEMLHQLLSVNNGSLRTCVEELLLLEHQGQAVPVEATMIRHQAAAKAEVKVLLEDVEAFPALAGPADTARSSPGTASPAVVLDWAKVAGTRARHPFVPTQEPCLGAAAICQVTTHKGSGVNSGNAAEGGRGGGERTAAAQQQPVAWVSTGAMVAAQYADVRGEARDWARLRNVCFEQATLAYLAGDKRLAKELSQRGRQHAEKMWAAHSKATTKLVQQRGVLRQQAPGGPIMLDLHGFHAAEALWLLQEYVKQGPASLGHPTAGRWRCGVGHSVQVVVGMGKHSVGPGRRAMLADAVEGACKQWGLAYKQLRPGLLEIRLPPL